MIVKISFLFILIAFVLCCFTSCPQPLTEEDVVAAQDKLAPTIEVNSPGENESYFSQVEFSLSVKDDAQSEADRSGDLASISFDISNDDFRGGKIQIGSDGSITQDSSYGPDEIVYDSTSGEVSFSFSTIKPNIMSGLISVAISAEDRNGNAVQESIALFDSDGPWIEYTVYDTGVTDGTERTYTEGSNVKLSGYLGNSVDSQDKADQLSSLSWSVLGKSWTGELYISEDSDSSTSLSTYNVSQKRFEAENTGIAYPEFFVYYPETRYFETELDIPFGAGSVLPFEVSATDMNEHTTTMTVNAFSDESGPEVIMDFPRGEDYAYFSAEEDSSDGIEGYINGGIGDLQSFMYELTDSTGDYSTGKIDITATAFDEGLDENGASNEFYFIPDITALVLESDGVTPYPTYNGNINLIIYAVNDDDFESRPKVTVYEDSDGPEIENFEFTSNHTNTAYANSNSILTMVFDVSDTSTDAIDLTVDTKTIGGDTAPLLNSGSTYTLSSSAWTSGMTSDQNLTYSIVLKDRLGNSKSYTQDSSEDHQVMYYEGAPDASHLDSLVMEGVNAPIEYAVAGEDIVITIDSKRVLNSIGTIVAADFSNAVAYDGGDNTKATIILSRSDLNIDSYVNFSFNLTDAAGNTAALTQANLTAGNVVRYDSLAPDAPGTPSLDDNDDTTLSGYPGSSDGVTKNYEDLTIEGTAEAGATVKVYVDSTEDFSVTAVGGSWSGDLSGSFNHGSYSITANATDPAGNVSEDSPGFTLQVMRNLPDKPTFVDLRTEDDSTRSGYAGTDDNITNIAAVNIDGTTIASGSVILYVNGSDEPYVTADGSGNWTVPVTMVAEGPYLLEAKGADIAGNESSDSTDLSVVLDQTNDNIPDISLHSDDDKGYSDSDGITNVYTDLTLIGTMTDDDDYGILLRGLLSDGLTPVDGLAGLTGSESSGTWSVDADLSSATDEDTMTVCVQSVDAAGNPSSAEGLMTLIIDSTEPVLSAVDSIDLYYTYDTGYEDDDDLTNYNNPIQFDVNVSSFDATEIRASDDDLYIDISGSSEMDSLVKTKISNTGIKNLMTDRAPVEAAQTITATICDLAGNASQTALVSLDLTVDRSEPVATDVTVLSLIAGDDKGFQNYDGKTNETGMLTFDYTISGYEEPGYLVLHSDVDGSISDMTLFTGSGAGQITSDSGFSDNSHIVTVTLYDKAGNEKTGISGSDSLIVDFTAPGETINTFILNADDDLGRYSNDGKTSKSTALLFDLTISGQPETLYINLYSTLDGDIVDYEAFDSWDLKSDNGLSAGSHSISATLNDVYGNEVDTAGPITIITDYTPPTGTLDSIDLNDSDDTGYDFEDDVTSRDQIQFDFELSGVSELSYIKLSSDQESFSDLSSQLAVNTTTGSITSSSGLSEGTHSFTAELFDIFGNSSGSEKVLNNVVLDHSAPATDISNLTLAASSDLGNPGDDKTAETGILTFSFDLTEAGFENPSYILLESNKETPNEIARTLYSFGGDVKTITLDSGLVEEDIHTIKATVYDEAGNRSSGSYVVSYSLTTDYTGPILALSGMVKTGTETISSITYNTLIIDLDEAHGSPVLAGTGIVGDFQDLATDIYFDAHASLTHSIKAKLQTDGGLEIIQHDGSSFADFPDGDNFVLNVGSSYTDEAGNRVRKSDDSKDLESIQFDYSSSVNVDAQTGLVIPELYNPYEDMVENSKKSSKSSGYSYRAESDLIEDVETVLLQEDSDDFSPVPYDDISQLKQATVSQGSFRITEPQVLPGSESNSSKVLAMTSLVPETTPDMEIVTFMEKVEENRIDYEAALERLRHPPMSKAHMEAMELRMTRELPVVEELIVYTSPLPMAFEKPVSLGKAETEVVETSPASYRYILLQVFGGLLILLITGGFLWFMKRMQRQDKW